VTRRIKHACGHHRLHDMSSFLLLKLGGGQKKQAIRTLTAHLKTTLCDDCRAKQERS
jgi:hypothetical protein